MRFVSLLFLLLLSSGLKGIWYIWEETPNLYVWGDWKSIHVCFKGYQENCDAQCVSSCKPFWVEVENHCYHWSTLKLNWLESEETCRKQGGHLASIPSQAVHDNITAQFQDKEHKTMWIGGTDQEKEGVWKWTDCSLWNFTPWKRGQPDNIKNGQHCLEFFGTEEGGKWNDDDCTIGKYFLCSQKLCPPGRTS